MTQKKYPSGQKLKTSGRFKANVRTKFFFVPAFFGGKRVTLAQQKVPVCETGTQKHHQIRPQGVGVGATS